MATKFEDSNLKVYRGDREAYRFTVTENGSAKDLSDATNPGIELKYQIREELDSATFIHEQVITDAIDGNDHAAGIIVVVIESSVTANLPEKSRYDVQVTYGTEIYTVAKGQLLLTKDVTRP